MTQDRGIGPMPPPGIAESVPDAVGGSGLASTRLAGAVLGAILAAVAIVGAVRVDALLVANPEDSPIAIVFGPDGISRGEPLGALLVWSVGPVAALIAGWLLAVPASRGVDGSGLWMGTATYVLAIGIAPVVFLPSLVSEGIESLRSIGALPFVWLFAGAALAPLLAVCLVAGPIWATILRRTTGGHAGSGSGTRPSSRSLPVWPIAALTVLTFAGWAVGMAVLTASWNAGFD
jgi:hypothetical protein